MKSNGLKNLVLGFALGAFGLVTLAVNLPHTFTAGTPISAAQVNENFSTLHTALNTLETSKQNRVGAKCDDGSAIKQINPDGTVLCETDDIGSGGAGYTAGAGLKLSGTQFSVDTAAIQARVNQTCPAGQSIREIKPDGTVTCESDDGGNGDITAVIAGQGLQGGAASGDATLSLANDGVTTAKLADTAVTTAKLADSAVTTAKLGNNAITSSKTLDEPGVAQNVQSVTFTLSGSFQNVLSADIIIPGPGYVLVMASAQVNLTHTNGTRSNIEFGVSASPTTSPGDQLKDIQLPENASTGTYLKIASVQKIFPVDAPGTATFYLNAREASGDAAIREATLSLIYFPTGYGVVGQ
ncbi:MAG: hypothetical protein N2318_04425 [Meiothermus sp.]|nr:hypothetical protein [Meiothermus sp.]